MPPSRFGPAVVVSPSSSGNSLGRSLVVAEVASKICERVELIAYDDGPLWGPARGAGIEAAVGDTHYVRDRLAALSAASKRGVVVVVKPERRSATLVRRWLRATRSPPLLWFDEDDHDVAIAQYWTQQAPPRQRVTSQLSNPNAAWRMRRRLAWWSENADVITSSSLALASTMYLPHGNTVILPHVRDPRPYTAPTPSEALRFGFLGTPHQYKGVPELVRLLELFPDAELHVFKTAVPIFEAAGIAGHRIRAHDGHTPDAVGRAMRDVDVVVLPQDAREDAARFQLPAKLLDALQHGRPALVSSTPVTDDYSRPGIVTVRDWFDDDAVRRALRELGDSAARAEVGAGLARWCAEEFSIAKGAAGVAAVLGRAE